MESLYLLIPIAILFVIIAVIVFIWAVKSEQFEDLDRQGHSILFDDDSPKSEPLEQDRPAKMHDGDKS
ncbi:MAG: cbb3-type cytochrome oxidase assembly protein CcoS [Vibrio sp.]